MHISHKTVRMISVYKVSTSHPGEDMIWRLREDETKDGYTASERVEQLALKLVENPKILGVRIAVDEEPMTTIEWNSNETLA